MTIIQALSKSEEFDCYVLNREVGLKIKHDIPFTLFALPKDGWELDDTPSTIVFETTFLGCSIVEGFTPESTAFAFLGAHLTSLPKLTKVKVTIEPQC